MIHRTGPAPGAALILLLSAALALGTLLFSASPAERNPDLDDDGAAPRVLLIGLDAADWIMLDRWIGEGELPNLARLAESGLRGDLRTLRPIISPLLWTSIATGQTPDRHGVTDFFSRGGHEDSLRPVGRDAVLVPTVWEILSGRGLEVAVTAWWASWPADHTLNGRVVTDQVQFAFPGMGNGVETAAPDTALYHPAELAVRLQPCRVRPADLDHRAVGAIAPCTPENLAPGSGDPDLELLRRSLAATASYYRMTRKMLRDGQPDFAAVYFLGTDTIAHLFGQAAGTDPRHLAPLRFYRLVDAMIGDLCSLVSPATMVVLVSDHGFYTGEDRPAADPADFRHQAASWHRPLGMVLFNAPWIAPGRLDDASVLDVAPTLLWQVLGERFQALPGRVLAEARRPGAAVSGAWRPGPVPNNARNESGRPGPDPDRYLEQLRALGYLEEQNMDRVLTTRPVIHLADYLQWAGRSDEALEQLLEARDRLGENPLLLARLAIQQSRAGDQPGALETIQAALEQGWNPAAGHQLAAAVGICCAAGRPDQAGALLDTFDPAAFQSAPALTARAVLAEHLGRRQEALERYTAALEADPASGQAAHSICRLLEAGDPRLTGLGATVRQAAEEQTGDAAVQLNAGRLLLASGDPEAALGPLGRAVHLQPDLPDPRLLLARALYLSGRPAETFERLAEGLRWHPGHPRLLAAAGAAAIRAGYLDRGRTLLKRAVECGGPDPHIEAALTWSPP